MALGTRTRHFQIAEKLKENKSKPPKPEIFKSKGIFEFLFNIN